MHFTILGGIEAVRDGDPVAVGGPRQRRLLGVLLAHRGATVSATRLVDAVWPDGDAPAGAARSVLTYVSRLRGALGDGVVARDRGGYRIDLDGHTCDVDEVEALVDRARRAHPDQAVELYDRALAIWVDPAFGDLGEEWWAVATTTRLAEAHLVAREERAASCLALGQPEQAVPDLRALVVDHPLRERPVALLMQALDATGRTAEALRAYQDLRRGLADETGLDPGPEVAALERALVGADDATPVVGPGRPLRGYTLEEAIGEGASGRVYAAVQPGTERRVAIRAIRPDRADEATFIRRFDAEARLVARLEHPHIVPLYDYWREPGGAFLVFRLLGGGSVREAVVAGGAWSLARADALVEQVGGALLAAHAAGVVHQDVAATNVLLDADGAAYLTDFGIARAGTDRADTGDPPDGTADERVDVAGLARLAWEVLAGEAPPAGVEGPLPRLAGRRAELPDGLDAVLARATAADGYASVAELVLGWRAALAGAAPGAGRTRSSDRAAVPAARREEARRLRAATAAGVNPYKGLRPFDEADAGAFHGREEAVARLLDDLDRRRWVTVVGASGSGKSSLVRAGLVPRLRARGDAVVVLTPGDDPSAALRAALAVVSSRPPGRRVTRTLVRDLGRELGPVVVVVDQLEECWTRADEEGRDAFLAVLADVVGRADAAGGARVVATIRADLLDRPLQHPAVGALVGAGAHVLGPLSPGQLDAAVVEPSRRAGITIDEDVVAELVTEAAAQPGSLPLLQFALTELYDARVDGRIDAAALAALGGMAGAIGRRAEACWAALDARGRAATQDLFSRLVVVNDDAPPASRRCRRTEVSDAAWTVAERFVEGRLLVADHDPATREPSVQVAHEALLVRWDRLAGWIAEDRQWIARLAHLAAAARSWDDGGRRPADLYRGARLEAAAEALEAGRPMSVIERRYIDTGCDVRDAEGRDARRTAHRLRRLLVGVGALLVLALAAGVVALDQRRSAEDSAAAARASARRAEIEVLVGRAEALRRTEPDLAALLAVEAFRLTDTARTRAVLRSSATDGPGRADASRPPGRGPDAATRDVDAESWVEAACRTAGRNLTAEEWATHIGALAAPRPTCPGLP